MGYTKESVRQMILTQMGGAEALAKSVSVGEGGGRESQHHAAIQFWTLALALPVEVEFNRAVAQSEIVRHKAALEALHPPVSARQRAPVV